MSDINRQEEALYIKEYYEKMKNLKEKEAELKEIEKETIEKTAEDLAESMGLRKKDNTVDVSKIKKGLVKDALLIALKDERNKLKEKLEILEEYIDRINSNSKESDIYEDCITRIEAVAMVKDEMKDLKQEYKEYLEPAVIKQIDIIIKNEITPKKENEDFNMEENIKEYIEKILKGQSL